MKCSLPLLILSAFGSMTFTFCSGKKAPEFRRDPAGYYYKLLRFEEPDAKREGWEVAHVSVAFSTQSDSVFWDSYNNLSDNYFVRFTQAPQSSILDRCMSRFALNDSACVLVKPADFFRDQFGSAEVPFFSQGDSVVKISFKIRELISGSGFTKIRLDLERREMGRIIVYFGSKEAVENARDPLGFFWVERPDSSLAPAVKGGDVIKLSYEGSFLNGRFLERSPQGFELVYGTPDQLLKGINYVIPRIKIGQSAKIILPSRLAFGEKGSSNGTVPPFTPLVYEIKINQ